MPNYWKIAPGRQAQFWRDCVEKRCIPINWLNQSDLSALSVEQIESLLTDREQGAANSARSVHAFVHDIQPGDRVFANAGKSSCKGMGIVTSDYLPPKHKKIPSETKTKTPKSDSSIGNSMPPSTSPNTSSISQRSNFLNPKTSSN